MPAKTESRSVASFSLQSFFLWLDSDLDMEKYFYKSHLIATDNFNTKYDPNASYENYP